MTKVTFIEYDGTEYTIDATDGLSLMEVAVQNLVPGIDGDCGGACACATCMVFVPEDWMGKLDPKEPMEATMLDFSEHVEENSRLSCQLKVSPALEGIRVTMPESQH